MHPITRSAALLSAVALSASASAQTLLRDFDPTPQGGPPSANVQDLHPIAGGRFLFAATDRLVGTEFWTTDGTAAGTALLADLAPGISGLDPHWITDIGSGVYLFSGWTPAGGRELWRTDGTVAGTSQVADIRPGTDGSGVSRLTRVGNRVIFFADDGVHGIEPWISDGSATGTRLLLDVVPGPRSVSNGIAQLGALGQTQAVFTAFINNEWQLWVTDLNAAGTRSVFSFGLAAFQAPRSLTPLGNRVVFQADAGSSGSTLWATDGTTAGTLAIGPSIPAGGAFQRAGGWIYFTGIEAATGAEPWKTDGTVAGTSLVADLVPGGGVFGSEGPRFVGELAGGDVLFFAGSPTGPQLYRSNGTAAGTTIVANLAGEGVPGYADWGTRLNGLVYFSIPGGTQPGLYRTDGTAQGTTFVGAVQAGPPVDLAGQLLFAGDDGTSGRELWTSNGTPSGTRLLVDIDTLQPTRGSNPLVVGNFRDQAIVLAEEAATGREIWLSDGTPGGTRLLADFVPGPGSGAPAAYQIAANDRAMFFFAGGGVDGDPWLSDGTTAGTAQLDIQPTNSGFRGWRPAAFGDRFVFAGSLPGSGSEPWISDGTVAGTRMLVDVRPGTEGSDPLLWLPVRDRMVFWLWSATGQELWTTDGTTAGTRKLTDVYTTASSGFALDPLATEDWIYFRKWTAAEGVELWRTDGNTVALCADVEPGPGDSMPSDITPIAQGVVYRAVIGRQPRLVMTPGIPLGTQVLSFTASEIRGPHPLSPTEAAFFVPGATDVTLFRTDGTNAGTVAVRSFAASSSFAAKVGVDRLLATLDDGIAGQELWSLDGTSSGSIRLTDLVLGHSWPMGMTRTGDRVVFAADSDLYGRELFSVPMGETDDWAFETYGSGCPGSNGGVPEIDLSGVARSQTLFSVDLTGARPGALSTLAIAETRAASPLSNCTLWVGGATQFDYVSTDAAGAASLSFRAPLSAIGLRFTFQFATLDPGGAAYGAASSTAGLELVVGS